MMNLTPNGMQPNQPSPEFVNAVNMALHNAIMSQDELVQFMVKQVPVYVQVAPTREQAQAGGCVGCVYLGLWADRWPGYPQMPHGMIWMFEQGIRSVGGNLQAQTLATLLHEMDHALQRDHVLEALNRDKIAAMAVQARGCRGCGYR